MTEERKYRNEDWLRKQYSGKQLVANEIAEKCGCSERTIQRWLKRHEIERRPGGSIVSESKIEYPKLRDKDWIQSEYVEKGKSCVDIAKGVGCSKSSVQKWLDKHNISTTTNKQKTPEKLKDEEWLREQYVQKEETGYRIADKLECSQTTVYSWIRKHGIEQQYNGKVSGENHWWYSGGSKPYGKGWNVRKRENVRKRDCYTCQDPKCTISQQEHLDQYDEKLHVHHLRKARDVDDPAERNAKENLITLCRDCHRRWEKIADAGLVPEVVT